MFKKCQKCNIDKELTKYRKRVNPSLKTKDHTPFLYGRVCNDCNADKIKARNERAYEKRKAKKNSNPVFREQILSQGRRYANSTKGKIGQQKMLQKYKLDPEFMERRSHTVSKYNSSSKGRETKKAYQQRSDVIATRIKQQSINLKIIVRGCLDRAKKAKINSDIDYIWFKTKLIQQNDCCHYCERKLKHEIKGKYFNQPSIDRINGSVGYLKSNCVISCLFCNFCKSSTEYNIFMDFIDSLRSGILHETFSTYLMELQPGNMRRGIAAIDRRNNLSDANTITTDQVKDMIKKQNSKCAITGIPFQNSRVSYWPMKPSIDRLDSKSDHRVENCQIILMGLNFAKNNKNNEELLCYLQNMQDDYWIGLKAMNI